MCIVFSSLPRNRTDFDMKGGVGGGLNFRECGENWRGFFAPRDPLEI